MNSVILALIISHSAAHGIDPFLAMSVARVESNFKMSKIGRHGEVGIFQLRPKFFKKDLQQLKVNISEGIKHLAYAKRYCGHKDDNTWLVCYNAGVEGGTKIKHPKQFSYYKKVMEAYERLKTR